MRAARGRGRRGRGRAASERLGIPARSSARALRGRRVRLGRAGQALRARPGRPDRWSTPRAPRRSERFASLIRIDTINGRPADEVADSTRFDDLPAAYPTERFRLGSGRPDDQGDRVADAVRPRLAVSRSSAPHAPARPRRCDGSLRRSPATRASSCRSSSPASGPRRSPTGRRARSPPSPRSASPPRPTLRPRPSSARRPGPPAGRTRSSHAVVLIDTLGGMRPPPRASCSPRRGTSPTADR